MDSGEPRDIRWAPVLSFGLLVASIASAATLVFWSLTAQWGHWARHGEAPAWFSIGYGLETLGLDLEAVYVCRADSSWQDLHRAAAWVLDLNLSIGALALAALLVPAMIRLANGIERGAATRPSKHS